MVFRLTNSSPACSISPCSDALRAANLLLVSTNMKGDAHMNSAPNHSDAFLAISVWLTGFDATELEGTGMTESYLQTLIEQNDAETVFCFFAEVDSILTAGGDEAATNAAIAARLMPSSCYNSMAKNIILMWYTGEWYSDTGNPPEMTTTQISAQSYIQGLMWSAAETHPPGAKQPGYGSWAETPIRIPSA
jgi:hypothetical protein